MVRCFIGIMIPEELKNYLENVKKELSLVPIACKFVENENFHICLSFLGEVDDNKIKSIAESLDSVCAKFSSFKVTIGGVKIIPNEKYLRVLALEVVDDTTTIEKIMADIKKNIGGDSHPPHLTLCRVKNIRDKQSTIEKIKSLETESISFLVSSIQLIKSELKKTGPVYSSAHNSRLQ